MSIERLRPRGEPAERIASCVACRRDVRVHAVDFQMSVRYRSGSQAHPSTPIMRSYTIEEIRRCFAASSDFDEIFDAFESALQQKVKDIELYRLLFWNHTLTPDEVRLFGEKLVKEFPELAYDVFSWLATIFETTYSASDNYELALHYYRRAAQARPAEPDPYLDACDCYDPDLNIPPLASLIEFVTEGLEHVARPSLLYRRMARLYEAAGRPDQAERCRRKAEELENPPGAQTV